MTATNTPRIAHMHKCIAKSLALRADLVRRLDDARKTGNKEKAECYAEYVEMETALLDKLHAELFEEEAKAAKAAKAEAEAAAAAAKAEAAAPAAAVAAATTAAIIEALTDAHTCATPGNVAAVAELATAFNSFINEPHRHLLNAVYSTLTLGMNCVGEEQYALAALYSKHRAAGWSSVDALNIASDELEALSRRTLEDVALAA